MSFRHFETGLRLIIDKNTNIPKVETVNDSRIYFSKCSKRKAFATVRGFENQQVLVVCKDVSTRLKQKLLHHNSSRSIEKDFTIKNLNKIIDMLFSFQCARNCKLNRTLKIA